jgi:plastocyanin
LASRFVATLGVVVLAVLAIPAASAGAATRTVTMGPTPDVERQLNTRFASDVNDFFPHGTTIHVGDRIRFVPTTFHTVDFPRRGQGAIPLFSPTGEKVVGARDAADLPFWFNGQDQLGFTPALTRSGFGKSFTFNGRRRVESGLPLQDRPKPMTVRFTRAGRFTYLCDVHAGMKGTVRVRPRGRRIPTARQHAAKVRAQVARGMRIARQLGSTEPPAGVVSVGASGRGGVERFQMFPDTQTVPVGTTLRFEMSARTFEVHTATFGPGDPEADPNSYLGQLAESFTSPTVNPAAIYQSELPGTVASLTPRLHGNGFWNSGVMDRATATPPPSSNSVRFGEAGTYDFFCLIHPFMKGTVVVQ